mmetsp:Transcript_23730/g.65944  ORF Transcript_23730/g.65944 Transcript_23730/m.65944 type:complete len:838 (+) Transcript_23730:274-2787(+)|eukprot:CAMPEP_0168733982 /NCGR_PEP_ID=MMETSP0724-20121128/8576_1 /TAXON_ID=265536 /ORGANISM="Amphiprora sp., Strain CCMP467" /LENGTH=837 /DNA_ID=CAMNT_0008781067 /DNA_START=183 /DNA_END=2696 /DNA_ORIENTATION=-
MTDWNDFTAIPSLGAAGSASTFGSSNQHQPWQRSVASLQVASQNLLEQSSPAAAGSTGLGSRYGMESAYGKPQQQSTVGHAAITTKPHKSAREAVEEHHQKILNNIVIKEDEAIQSATNEEIMDFLEKSWQRKHNQWSEELSGGRGTAGASNLLTDSTNTPGGRQLGGSASSFQNAAISYGGANGWPLPSGTASQMDPQSVQAHGQAVQDLPRLMPSDMARLFASINDPSSSPANSGYVTAWKWMEVLLEHQQRIAQSFGAAAGRMNPVDQAIATIRHLTRQVHNRMDQQVQSALTVGQNDVLGDTFLNPIANRCEAYARLQLGAAQATPWPTLYFCLRSGHGSDAALEVWQTTKQQAGISDTVADAITRLLGSMTAWEEATSIPELSVSDRHIVGDFLQSVQSNRGNDGNNSFSIHKEGVLALLSGAGDLPVSSNVHGFITIEDYLFGQLNKALLQREPDEHLTELGKSIQIYGPSYFGDAESGGWSYSLPLLMTQQYSKALTHLVEFGGDLGLLQATHLGLLLANSKIELEDLGESDVGFDGDLAASLLVAYAHRLIASAGQVAALEYLSRIPLSDTMRKEVASLIAKTGDLEKLAGRVDENGNRQGDHLLKAKFSDGEISQILSEAAEILLRENDNQKVMTAAMCYMLAGKYDGVLWVLNDMLSPPDRQSETRSKWIEQTKGFRSCYLDNRTQVYTSLERERKLRVVETNKHLMDMNLFFQHLHTQRYSDAWVVAQKTQLLPMDQRELAAKQDNFRNLEDAIKRCFSSFLVAVMRCLYFQHAETKAMGRARDIVTAQHLKELQAHARVLLSFAGMLGLASDQGDTMSQLEAKMI